MSRLIRSLKLGLEKRIIMLIEIEECSQFKEVYANYLKRLG